MESWIFIVIALVVAGVLAAVFLPKPKNKKEISLPPAKVDKTAELLKPTLSFKERLSLGLSKSREEIWGKLLSALSQNEGQFDSVEEILYTADLSPKVVEELIENLKKKASDFKDPEVMKNYLFTYLKGQMSPYQTSSNTQTLKPKVIMIVGVNGAGKTTTIGKLATRFQQEGKKIIVGACDTFRAAAVDQLQVWCERAQVDMLRAKDGADPSGVAFDTVTKAQNEGYDICLIDTAGRLHTNTNLMEELTKTKRVMSKVMPDAPHEVWLVLDAITGQNALRQALEFHKSLQLTGIIFTKCDGSAKAGSAVGIVQELQVPIRYIGVGESVEDLNVFNLDDYLKSLIGLT